MSFRHNYHANLVVIGLLACCLLLVGQATTYTVGAAYSTEVGAIEKVYSYYIMGITFPLDREDGFLHHSLTVTSGSASQGYSIFVHFENDPDTMTMFGPAGTALAKMMIDIADSVTPHQFFVFAPLSQTCNSQQRPFSKNRDYVFWTMPNDQAQSIGMLAYTAQRDKFAIKHLYAYYPMFGLGHTTSILLPMIGKTYKANISVKKFANGIHDYEYDQLIALNPRILHLDLMAEGVSFSRTISKKFLADPTLIALNTTIAISFMMQFEFLMFYNELAEEKKKPMLPPENIVSAVPVPGVDATDYVAASHFVEQAGSSFDPDMSHCIKNYMMAGWVSGTALVQALSKYTSFSVGHSTMFNLFMNECQNSYVVSDLFIGTFSPRIASRCDEPASKRQGIVCNCRFAGKNLWFHTFVKSGTKFDTASIRGMRYQFVLSQCGNFVAPGDHVPNKTAYEDQITTHLSIFLAGFAPTDNAMIKSVCEQTQDVIARLSNMDIYDHTSTHAYRGYCIPSTMGTLSSTLATHTTHYLMDTLMGVMPTSIGTPKTFILDYIPQMTQPHVSQANLVYLFPTLEQDLYVLASYLGGIVTDASVVCAAVGRSTVSGSIVNLLRTTLTTFGISLPHGHVIQSSTGLGVSISDRCTHTFAIGMGEDDAAGLLSYLQTNANSYLLVPFDDLTKYYTSLSASLDSAGAAVTNRFLFATNIPLWTSVASNPTAAAASAPLSTVSQFLQSMPVGLQTPAAVRAYFVAMLYDQLSRRDDIEPADVQQMLYANMSLVVDGVEFGPFSTQCLVNVETGQPPCMHNYGARDISVWSYTSVVNPTIAALQKPGFPSLIYTSGSKASLVLPSAEEATGEECVDFSLPGDGPSQTTSTPPIAPTPTSPSVLGSSSGPGERHSSWSEPGSSLAPKVATCRKLLIAVSVSLAVTCVVIALLLMVKWGMLRFCNSLLERGCLASGPDGTALLLAREKQHISSLSLQQGAQDSSRAPSVDATQPLTVVCVDVAHFRALWTTAPDVMSCAVADYQRCVRQSILRHGCYEVNTVDGLFVIACYSADDGVRVALDCAAAARSLDAKSATAVNAAYAALGLRCAAPAGCGLRLRIAVHCGPASTGVGAGARFRGGAVDDAVCAAYCSKVAWQVVVTESARCSLADAAEYRLSPLGRVSLVHGGATELFAVTKQQLEGNASSVAVPLVTESSTHVLRALDAGVNRPDAVASGLCRRYLEAFLAHCCGVNGAVYVTAVAQCLGLSALSRDDYEDEDAYFAALLRAVCGRLGALLECRHGVASESVARKQASGVSWSASVETSVECCDGVNVSTAAGQGSKKRGNSHKHRKATRPKRPLLRHFSYAVMENVED